MALPGVVRAGSVESTNEYNTFGASLSAITAGCVEHILRVRYNLLFPNASRQRLLLGVILAWLSGAVLLIVWLNEPIGFGLLIAYVVVAFAWSFFPKLSNRLFWCPFWAVVAADGVAWQKPTDEQIARYNFVDILSYRFVPGGKGKGSVLLRLSLHNGTDVELVYQFSAEAAAFQAAAERAILAYNRTKPMASLVEKASAGERFLASRTATYVLGGLLGADVLAIVWGTHVGALGVQYAPLVLSFPYFLAWLAFVGKRP